MQNLTNNPDRAAKIKKPICKIIRVWTKNEEIFEKFKKTLRFFGQNLYGELTFFIIFYQIFLGVSASSRKGYMYITFPRYLGR